MDRSPNLLAFVVAGLAAFSVDVSTLGLLTSVGLNPLTARLVGLAAAAVIGWMINRTWTYAEPNRPSLAEFGRYVSGGLISTGVNFSVFALILIIWPNTSPLEALIVGAAAGLSVAFAGYARFVFREDP
jgi:putative flippase GtrA